MTKGRVLLFSVALVLIGGVARAGNTVCSSTNTDWYTNVVGETPCTTYERLRQTCNAEYEVGTLTFNTPPDHCDDQVSSCCCNSISFALSMLCLACQDDRSNGFDAGVGAYQQYLTRSDGSRTCGAATNQSFTTDVQAAVCNQKIKIEDALYGLFWGTGDWFYVYTRDTITKDHLANNNNTFTHCESTWNNITTTTSSSESMTSTSSSISSSDVSSSGVFRETSATNAAQQTAIATSSNTNLGTGAIAGIAVGALVLIGLIGTALLLFCRRRRRRGEASHMGPGFDEPEMIQSYTTAGGVVPSTNNTYRTGTDSSRPLEPLRWPPPSTITSSATERSWGNTSYNLPSPPLERHTDAGPVRRPSGRLPPAYGSFATGPVSPNVVGMNESEYGDTYGEDVQSSGGGTSVSGGASIANTATGFAANEKRPR